MTEVRLQPPAPDKELPFLVVNMFHFASDADAKKYEEAVTKWWPNLQVFVGRITGDVSEKYTHCIVWQYKDFDEYKRNLEDYASTLKELQGSEKPEGEWPGYLADHLYACRVADYKDPVLIKHGVDEWTRRMLATLEAAKMPDPRRAALWQKAVSSKIAKDWGEGGVRSKWE